MIGLLSFHIFHIQAVKLDQALAPYFGDPQEFINEGKMCWCIQCRCKWKEKKCLIYCIVYVTGHQVEENRMTEFIN